MYFLIHGRELSVMEKAGAAGVSVPSANQPWMAVCSFLGALALQ